MALEQLGSQEPACGWARQPPLWAGFQGPDWAGHGLCLSPRPCQPLRGSDLGSGYELGLSVYCPVMHLPQSSLNPMCTYSDVLLYILLFPCFRVATILKRFVTCHEHEDAPVSAVLCLPACLCVSAAAFRGQAPPRERVKSVSPPRGYPSLASHSGPPEPRAPRASQRRPEHRPERQQQRRVREGGVATGTPTSASSFGRQAPPALPAASPNSTTTIGRLGPSPVERVDHNNRFIGHPED